MKPEEILVESNKGFVSLKFRSAKKKIMFGIEIGFLTATALDNMITNLRDEYRVFVTVS